MSADLIGRVSEVVQECAHDGDGFWRTCSGCHESEDGHDVGHYPFSEAFRCKLGGGCSDCGGIGAIWDTTDYETMGQAISECSIPDLAQRLQEMADRRAHTLDTLTLPEARDLVRQDVATLREAADLVGRNGA